MQVPLAYAPPPAPPLSLAQSPTTADHGGCRSKIVSARLNSMFAGVTASSNRMFAGVTASSNRMFAGVTASSNRNVLRCYNILQPHICWCNNILGAESAVTKGSEKNSDGTHLQMWRWQAHCSPAKLLRTSVHRGGCRGGE
jgi:hypothetical protein